MRAVVAPCRVAGDRGFPSPANECQGRATLTFRALRGALAAASHIIARRVGVMDKGRRTWSSNAYAWSATAPSPS
jgi:hypothetical protein